MKSPAPDLHRSATVTGTSSVPGVPLAKAMRSAQRFGRRVATAATVAPACGMRCVAAPVAKKDVISRGVIKWSTTHLRRQQHHQHHGWGGALLGWLAGGHIITSYIRAQPTQTVLYDLMWPFLGHLTPAIDVLCVRAPLVVTGILLIFFSRGCQGCTLDWHQRRRQCCICEILSLIHI